MTVGEGFMRKVSLNVDEEKDLQKKTTCNMAFNSRETGE